MEIRAPGRRAGEKEGARLFLQVSGTTDPHFHNALLLETSMPVSRLKEWGHRTYSLMAWPQKVTNRRGFGQESFSSSLENSYPWFIFKI